MLVCLGDAGLGRGGRPDIAALVSFGLPCEWNCPDRMDAANIHEEEPDPTVHLAAYFGSAHLHGGLKV